VRPGMSVTATIDTRPRESGGAAPLAGAPGTGGLAKSN
jgi:hypothetical protein